MPNIVMTKLKNQPKDKTVRLKIFDFLEKLAEDDSTYGLRLKKMHQAVDPSARTARIDKNWRAMLYLLEDKAKGIEFSRVVLFDVTAEVIPSAWMLDSAAPEERNEVMLHERTLLYVAASRARDALAVTWSGSPSPLLHDEAPTGKASTEEDSVATV